MLAKYLRGAPRERIFTASSLPKGSTFWKFLVSCRSVILPHLSWVVHYGKKTQFWDEVWNGHLVLFSIWDWSPLSDILSGLWGVFVADYADIDSSGPYLVSRWKSIAFLPIDNNLGVSFKEELQKISLVFQDKEDILVWTNSASNSYSVIEGYKSLSQSSASSSWPSKLFWHSTFLPKARSLSWLAVQDRVLTGMRWDRLGITGVFPCVFC